MDEEREISLEDQLEEMEADIRHTKTNPKPAFRRVEKMPAPLYSYPEATGYDFQKKKVRLLLLKGV